MEPGVTLRERLVIVLVRPQHPGNVGATARAMKNMGLRDLVLVDPPAFDMERARWMATSASDLLDRARFAGSVAEAVADCGWAVGCTARGRRWEWPVVEPDALARQAFDAPGRTAILFGQEDFGLDNEALAHCQALLRIPTDGMASLNLSQAVLLVCAALFQEARDRGWTSPEPPRQGRRSGGPDGKAPPKTPPAEAALSTLSEQAGVVEGALDVLALTPYMNGKSRDKVQVFVSSMLQRARPSRRDLNILRGMISKSSWRLTNPED
jgi:tRNA (cytidine32/uridine32-2'-O)-methyltransferase